ncbi:hypothetical protein L0152_03175 [bacterium]|nr:hypothetical protein [bacterium]
MIPRINNHRSFPRPVDESGTEQDSEFTSKTGPHCDGHSLPSPETASNVSQEKSINKMKADLLQKSLMEKLHDENVEKTNIDLNDLFI